MLSDHHEGAPPAIPSAFNLAAHVLAGGAASDLAFDLIGGEARLTYADLRAAVGGATLALASRVPPGGRVLMRLGNSLNFPLCYLAAISADLVPVVTSAQLTAPEVADLAAQVRPALAVQDPDLPAAPDVPQVTAAEFRAFCHGPAQAPVQGDPDRPAYIVFTSGTSGRPRGVVHAHRAILARQMMIRDWYGLLPRDRLLHAGAFNWTYTLGTGLMDPWSIGATALTLAPGTDFATLPDLLRAHDISIFAAAPGVYRRLLRGSGRIDAPALRHGLAAGEKLPDTLRARWRVATGTDIHEAFGMSECSTFISGAPDRPAAPGALGRPQRGRRVALLGDGTAPVPRGEEGEIAVHRSDPGLMLGYLDAPDDTRARMRGDWFLTGDRGEMDADGQITYLGRADDMMNAGGFRVSPIEVETAMARHPAITDCAAVECRVGAETSIIALAYTGEAVPEADLAAFAEARLARYKCPRNFTRVASLPRGANNKLLRRRVRAQLEGSS
ncbi:class I adenylate-forming enzyme family protein [Pseudaestuariivita atlantica]|uniref:Benzoate--CoA ligase n=1 Tax=Pseudaestuariivita atlantica TaxID=1317121 RepID=A0A0L1JMI4_9RHOB|nr:class I adenylate-forming enzyme family protein [Pseudaestuariivita atlantica]KNG92959.1 benzoate--CoA ligase [Pseudaestuariivita atlantica]